MTAGPQSKIIDGSSSCAQRVSRGHILNLEPQYPPSEQSPLLRPVISGDDYAPEPYHIPSASAIVSILIIDKYPQLSH